MISLTIILPVYNEAAAVGKLLTKLLAVNLPAKTQIIAVNDGSTDGTSEILARFADRIEIITLPRNSGKGSAVRAGIARAKNAYVLIQDADLEYNPADIVKLLVAVSPDSPVIYGSRNIAPNRQGYRHYVWGVAFLTWVANKLYGSRLTDIYTCYKLIPTKVLKRLGIVSTGFELEAELTAKLLKSGYPITEVPISYSSRKFTQGKKIGALDGVFGLVMLIRIRLSTQVV